MLVAGLLVIVFAFAGNAFANNCFISEWGLETFRFVILDPIVLRYPEPDYYWKIPFDNPECQNRVGLKAIVCSQNTRTIAEILQGGSTLHVHNDVTGHGAYVTITIIEYCGATNSDLPDDWDSEVVGGPSFRRTLGLTDLKAGLSASWRAGLPSWKNSRVGEALGSLSSSFPRDSKAGLSGSWKTGRIGENQGCSRGGLCSSKAGLLGAWKTGSSSDKHGCSRSGLCNSKAGLLGAWKTGSTSNKLGCSRGGLCSSKAGLSGDLKAEFSSKWRTDPARDWKPDFSGDIKVDLSTDWKSKPSSNWNSGFSGEFKADLSNDWKVEPSSNWKRSFSGNLKAAAADSSFQMDPSTFVWDGEPWKAGYSGNSKAAADDSPGVLTASLPDERKTGLTKDWTGYSGDLEKGW